METLNSKSDGMKKICKHEFKVSVSFCAWLQTISICAAYATVRVKCAILQHCRDVNHTVFVLSMCEYSVFSQTVLNMVSLYVYLSTSPLCFVEEDIFPTMKNT